MKISKFEIFESFEGHHGPLTSISCYSQNENLDTTYNSNGLKTSLSQLFLTSSFDGTVKLWSLKVIKLKYSTDMPAKIP